MSRYSAQKLVLYFLVFLLPTQLTIHFWPDYSLIFGIRVDYLAPAVYLTDLLVVILILLNFKQIWKFKVILLLVGLFALINTSVSVLPSVTLFKWLKILEIILLCIIVKGKDIKTPLYYSLIFFSLIGIVQFCIGSTLGGLFYYLGERNFSLNTPGIALVELFGQNYLRAYSTFPHPNVLAGYLLLSTIYLSYKRVKFRITFIVVVVSFLLTFSLSAFIALVSYLLLKDGLSKKYIFLMLIVSLILPYFSQFKTNSLSKEISERITLAGEAGSAISENFFLGTGLGTFPAYSSIRQPVHNVFLLVFAELGVAGLVIVFISLMKLKKTINHVLLPMLVIGLFDHYFLTIHQASILLFIIIALW